ncbi:hypothetical protein KKJ06_20080 [Xenorhabdus bovienii]|uniref:scabin-related ADP-ribosyltransferase n=1 Tax=Xenorhabdus bovienii TaxID=40576 RepID=UPI0023B34495|nr:hypothetical protein [Xenorhabdus bovienii]MDE9553291.1 hypothetical protein [Xenorhabdus bovienii]MDE9557653.1 hypothetical protein [Xenorhabdus bovienii]MDE9566675.1 hypothetical protein [Xenorhabdus bovienii]
MKILTAFFLLIFSPVLLAQTFFYRADSRAPTGTDGIFDMGFHPWEENDNLLEHVEAASLGAHGGAPTSAFVATSTDSNVAVDIYADGEGDGTVFYLYEVRPTNNFYSVETSFREWGRTDGGYLEALDDFGDQHEYVAFAGISREQIRSATLYRIENGMPVPSIVTNNPNYQEVTSAANTDPYPHMYPSGAQTQFSTTYACANSTSYSSASRSEILKPEEKFYKKMQKCNALILAEAFVAEL